MNKFLNARANYQQNVMYYTAHHGFNIIIGFRTDAETYQIKRKERSTHNDFHLKKISPNQKVSLCFTLSVRNIGLKTEMKAVEIYTYQNEIIHTTQYSKGIQRTRDIVGFLSFLFVFQFKQYCFLMTQCADTARTSLGAYQYVQHVQYSTMYY